MQNTKGKVLVTGGQGFLGSFLCEELLNNNYSVVSLDNFSKYGKVSYEHDMHPNMTVIEGDAKNVDLLKEHLSDADHFICLASLIGGISFFNAYALDLMIENERLFASAFEAAIWAYQHKKLKKITPLSSSMVYEMATSFPSKEGDEFKIAPPFTCYGFQKLAVMYFCRGGLQQYGLPYSIVNPFNCVGKRERQAKRDIEVLSGNIKLNLSHVIPDLITKVHKGQYPVHVLGSGKQRRHFTYAPDLARGIRLVMEDKKYLNQSFNISTPYGHSVTEVLELIWDKIGDKDKELKIINDPGYPADVETRVPDVTKAKELLGFESSITLSEILDDVIPYYTAPEFQNLI